MLFNKCNFSIYFCFIIFYVTDSNLYSLSNCTSTQYRSLDGKPWPHGRQYRWLIIGYTVVSLESICAITRSSAMSIRYVILFSCLFQPMMQSTRKFILHFIFSVFQRDGTYIIAKPFALCSLLLATCLNAICSCCRAESIVTERRDTRK